MKKKPVTPENYLERIPVRNPDIRWECDEDSRITLAIENKGAWNRMAQFFLKKPKISYVHLDENGSFVWPLIDGETDLTALGEAVEARFGAEAHPLYERLVKYFQILESYDFITWKTQ